MTHGLCEILKGYLSTVPFADRVAGLAKPLKLKSGDVEKTIPAYYRETKTSCLTDDYINLMPDSQLMSIMFWEEIAFRQTEDMPRYYSFEVDLRLVVWWNYEKVNVTLFTPDQLITSIIKKIPPKPPNTNNYSAILVEYLGQEPEGNNPFGRYTINEAEAQFMTYPYGSVALNFRVYFRMAVDCIDLITIQPKICENYLSFLIGEPTGELDMHIAGTGNLTINWGDGSTTAITSMGDNTYSHTYTDSDRNYFCYLTGDISGIVNLEFTDAYVLEVDGAELLTGGHLINFSNNQLTSVDDIFGDVDSMGTTGAYIVNMQGGTNADITAAGCVYVTNLTARGWTCLYNGTCP